MMELKESGFFSKRLMKRRATLASMTSLMHDKIRPAIKEEEDERIVKTTEGKSQTDKKETSDTETITKNVGERIAMFESETKLIGPDTVDESQGHDNNAFQSDKCVVIEIGNIDMMKFGEKGRKIGQFDDAKHVTYVSRGRTLITDRTNNRVQLCNKLGRALMVYGGDELAEPWACVLTNDGHIAVTSTKTKCVRILDEDGDILNSFGQDYFQCPSGIVEDKEGRLLVTDSLANRVFIHNSKGEFIDYLGKRGGHDDRFSSPRYICCNVNGDIIVSDTGNHCVKIFDKNGTFVKSFGSFGNGKKCFKFPHDVCTSKYGDIFVADHFNNRVSLYSGQGVFIRHLVTSHHGLIHPQGIAVSPDLNLYISHGHSKASEIIVVKLSQTESPENKNEGVISYV